MESSVTIVRVIPDESTGELFFAENPDFLNTSPEELVTSGFDILANRFASSGYGDIAAPVVTKTRTKIKPAVTMCAVLDEVVVGHMSVYDAHQKVPVEEDFPDVYQTFRLIHRNETILHCGDLGTTSEHSSNMKVIAKLLWEGYLFSREQNYARMFMCVNPKHVDFYTKIIGFKQTGKSVKCLKGLTNAPAVLLYATPGTVKVSNLERLGKR